MDVCTASGAVIMLPEGDKCIFTVSRQEKHPVVRVEVWLNDELHVSEHRLGWLEGAELQDALVDRHSHLVRQVAQVAPLEEVENVGADL